MQSPEALAAALGMVRHPRLVRKVRGLPLPKGMTFLLEVAAGESDALQQAAALTDRPQGILQEAAGFFIEQILLSQDADNYRTLGAGSQASQADLRRHMALLVRWLHPDVVSQGAPGPRFDRSSYVFRVTRAWEAVKTGERRVVYDTALRPGETELREAASRQRAGQAVAAPARSQLTVQNCQRKHFRNFPRRRASLLKRILMTLGGLR